MRKSFILSVLLIFLSYNMCFALNQVNKTLLLQPGYYYLFCFDESIVSYRPNSNKIINIESVTGIFNGKQELIVKPVKGINTNLTVQTSGNLYNFNILTSKNNEAKDFEDENQNLGRFMLTILPYPPKQNSNNSVSSRKKINYSDLGALEIDEPPHLPTKLIDGTNLEIDEPPGVN